MPAYPFTTVGCLIIAPDGDILLIRSHKWRDLYTIPGGKVHKGETLEKALIREIEEETGLSIENIQFAEVRECIDSPEFWTPEHFVMHDYIAYLTSDQQKKDVILNDEGFDYLWIQPDEALDLSLQSQVRELIEWYLKKHAQPELLALIGFEDLRILCHIGILPEEKTKEQAILIDLDIEFDISQPIESDNINQTIDYTYLSNLCARIAMERHFGLLETLASTILEEILEDKRIKWAKIKIKKPGAIPTARFTFVELEKTNEEEEWGDYL